MMRRAQFLFSGFYAGQFVLLGVQLPFFSGWLALHGFSAPQIGWVTGAALAARLAFGPFVAYWADHQDDERHALRIVSFVFAAACLVLWLEPGKALIALAGALVLWSFGLLVPLSDSAVLRADRADMLNYGQTRATGSAAFLAATLLGGLVLDRFGLGWTAPIMAVSALFAFVFSLVLPCNPLPRDTSRTRWREAPALISDHRFLLMIAAAGLVQGSHAVYYAFSILHWSAIGYAPAWIGALWAMGVVAEIFLLTRARGLARRFSPSMMIALGGAGALARWTVTALEPAVSVLFLVQLLHAFTFAAAYLGALEFIRRAVPERLTNTAMTLMSTTGVGAITGLATIGAGYLFAAKGAAISYVAMAIMGAGGMIGALLLSRLWKGEKIV